MPAKRRVLDRVRYHRSIYSSILGPAEPLVLFRQVCGSPESQCLERYPIRKTKLTIGRRPKPFAFSFTHQRLLFHFLPFQILIRAEQTNNLGPTAEVMGGWRRRKAPKSVGVRSCALFNPRHWTLRSGQYNGLRFVLMACAANLTIDWLYAFTACNTPASTRSTTYVGLGFGFLFEHLRNSCYNASRQRAR